MSKKDLLLETQIRRFMKLANLEPLTKNVLKETDEREEAREANQMPPAAAPRGGMQEAEQMDMEAAEPAAEEPAMGGEEEMGGEGETVEIGGDVDPEKQKAFEAAVQALADAMGIDVELEGQEEHAEEAGEEMHDLDSGDEEGGEEIVAPIEERVQALIESIEDAMRNAS